MFFEMAWSPAGLDACEQHGIAPSDAIAVVYMLSSAKFVFGEEQPPRSIWFVNQTLSSSSVITVVLDRQHRNIAVYDITNVRPANNFEITAWRSKL